MTAPESDRAAAERLAAFLDRLNRLALEDLRLISLPLPDPDERAAVLAEVDRAAASAGRGPLVAEARRGAQDAVVRAYARHQYEATWAGLNWGRSLGTTRDRLGIALAAEDAAVAAVMSDLLDEDTVAALTEGFERAAGMAGSTSAPLLSFSRPDRIGWLVWVLLALAGGGIATWYAFSGGLGILVIAFIAIVAVLGWRSRPA